MGVCVEAEPQLVFSVRQLITSETPAQHQQKLTGQTSAFSARNRVRVCRFDHPRRLRGRGECRVPNAPAASCALCSFSMHTSIHSVRTGNILHSPRDAFTAYT